MKVRFGAEAAEELRSAAAWYESRREGLGAAFVFAVDLAIDRAATTPKACVAVDAKRRRPALGRFPFWLVFETDPGALRAVAVAHMKRRPGYWRGR